MNIWTLYYQSLFEDDLDMLATSSKFMLSSDAPGGGTIEIEFDNGLDLLDYIDSEKLLADVYTSPFSKIFN